MAHFPRVMITGGMGRGRYGDAAVGDVTRSTAWVLHPKLHHVPLGLPRALSPHFEREAAWVNAKRGPRSSEIYVNHKPRPYRERILGHLRRALGQALPNNYAGKAALRSGTETCVGTSSATRWCCRRRAEAVGCYRHYCARGAVPLVFALGRGVVVWITPHGPFVGRVSAPFLERELARRGTFDWRRLAGLLARGSRARGWQSCPRGAETGV